MVRSLDYDDSAFFFFALAILTVGAVPLTFSVLRNVFAALTAKGPKKSEARSSAELAKIASLRQAASPLKKLVNGWFICKAVLMVVLWMTIALVGVQTTQNAEIAQFDPFEILDLVAPSSFEKVSDFDTSKVKRSYRKLSLKWHPDRWVTKTADEQAEASIRFMQVAKAHQTLSNPDALDNFLSFGNPDGKGALEVSIGLPAFLLEKGNSNLVLIVYLVALVVFLPLMVGLYYSNSKQYSDSLVLNETYSVYNFMIERNFLLKHMPEIFGLSSEFHNMPMRPSDVPYLLKLGKELKAIGGVPDKPCAKAVKLEQRWPASKKATMLLHAYLNRLTTDEYLDENLREDLKLMLKNAPKLLDAMHEIAAYKGARTVMLVMEFRQLLVQALWVKDSDLQQLPHIGENEVQHCKQGKGGIRGLSDFMRAVPRGDLGGRRKGTKSLTDVQYAELESVLPILPDIKLTCEVGVLNDDTPSGTKQWLEESAEGDFVTIMVAITRQNVKPQDDDDKLYLPHDADLSAKGIEEREKAELIAAAEMRSVSGLPLLEKQGFAHAPYWPYNVEEEWYLVVTRQDDDRVIGLEKIQSDKRVTIKPITFSSNGLPAGSHGFTVYLKSTTYLGVDQKQNIQVPLVPRDSVEMQEYHPEDIELENEPTLMEQLGMGPEPEEDSDFDDDEEEEEEAVAAAQAQAGAKAEGLRQRKGAKEETDDDDFEIVEEEEEVQKNK